MSKYACTSWVGSVSNGEGVPIPDSAWVRPKAKQLLKVLAVHQERRLQREQVQELLWPDLGPEAGYASLRKALHLARRALGDEKDANRNWRLLGFAEGVLKLSLEHIWIDADTFQHKMEGALSATDPSEVEAALTLYAGPLLPEDIYEEWASSRRRVLAQLAQRALLHLSTLREQAGDVAAAIELLQRVLTEDPSDEETHRRIMRFHVAARRRHLALRQYEFCADVLRRDLGIEPDDETEAVHREILDGSPGTALPGSVPLLPFAHPAQLSGPPFIGRERPLALLLQALWHQAGLLASPIARKRPTGSWSNESVSRRLILVAGEAA